MEAGVDSFKIEGRLKSPEYVAAAARDYRVAIDRHLEGHDLAPHELKSGMSRMGSVYSRGFFSGWLHGVDHQRLVDGTFSSNRGLRIGQIVDVRFDRMTVELDQPVELAPGDGLLWAYSRGEESFEEGAQIYSVRHLAKRMAAHKSTAPIAQQSSADETARTDLGQQTYELQFANTVTLRPDLIGAKLYLNHDSSLKKDLQKSFHDKNSFKRVPVDLSVEVALGTPLKVTMSDGANQCEALGSSLVQEAQNRAVSDDFIKDELGALGGSVFTLREFTIRRLTDRPIFYPHKELKEIRRALTAQLEELRSTNRIARYETAVAPSENIVSWLETQKRTSEPAKAGSEGGTASSTRLNVLLREKAQVFDMVEAWSQGRIDRESIDTVILDFEFGTDYEPSIRALKDAKIRCGIATTRILKPKEYTNLIRIERLQPDVVLVRNLGALHYFTSVSPFPGELRGDFSLNVTNHLTARYLLSKGLTSVTASYDMNSRQVTDFLVATDASRVEITAHQYMPSFHMEHCVFAAFLSKGSSFRDCGKPCEKHRVELKDQFGNRHQIKPDQECRNTMFNANSQSASRFVKAWQEQGLGFIRYEALYERGDELIEKVRGYQDLLSGKATPDDLIANLKLHEKYGLGEGPIGKTQEYQSRKKQ
jgi:putative protease